MSGRDVFLPFPFYLFLLTSYFFPLSSSHFVYDSHFVSSLYIVVITGKDPTLPTPVTPSVGVGSVGSVGSFWLITIIYARTRETIYFWITSNAFFTMSLSSLKTLKYSLMSHRSRAMRAFSCNFR